MNSSGVLLVSLLCTGLACISATSLAAGDYTLPQLCASYDRQEALLLRRLSDGTHSWERQRVLDQIRKLQLERANYCKGVTSDAVAGSS